MHFLVAAVLIFPAFLTPTEAGLINAGSSFLSGVTGQNLQDNVACLNASLISIKDLTDATANKLQADFSKDIIEPAVDRFNEAQTKISELSKELNDCGWNPICLAGVSAKISAFAVQLPLVIAQIVRNTIKAPQAILNDALDGFIDECKTISQTVQKCNEM